MPSDTKTELVARLLEEGNELLAAPRRRIDFTTGEPRAEAYLNDIERYPHLFVLGCVMDRQISYGRAWAIPYRIGREIGGFKFEHFCKQTKTRFESLFQRLRLHRFNKVAAGHFFDAVRRIQHDYTGDASRIWKGGPSGALVVRRFLEFDGVGIKIATMAANILVREFKMPLRDHSAIDISPDSRVMRFFTDNGLLRAGASTAELIYLARELSPEYPGLLDYGAFNAGGYKRPKPAEGRE